MQKLILETASFGNIPYGVKGDGLVSERELEKISRVAWDGGIRVIHTSWQYGLPKICEAVFSEFEWIEKSNDPIAFVWGERKGICGYSPNDVFAITPWCAFEMVQIPINILDGRFWHLIEHLKKSEHEIHARSVFLQGLLLMDKLPDWVPLNVVSKIEYFKGICEGKGLQPYEAALGYVLGLDEVDRVIVGVNTANQLAQLLTVKPLKWDYDFSITDENVLDPRRWPKA